MEDKNWARKRTAEDGCVVSFPVIKRLPMVGVAPLTPLLSIGATLRQIDEGIKHLRAIRRGVMDAYDREIARLQKPHL